MQVQPGHGYLGSDVCHLPSVGVGVGSGPVVVVAL